MTNRRNALSALAGIAVVPGLTAAGSAPEDQPPVRDAFKLKMGQPLEILTRSNPVKGKDHDAYVITIEKATFDLAGDSRLTAKLYTMIVPMARVDYWISAAVYDAEGKGTSKAFSSLAPEDLQECQRLGRPEGGIAPGRLERSLWESLQEGEEGMFLELQLFEILIVHLPQRGRAATK